MVAYLKASLQEKTYSDYLWAAREVEKEDSMELSQSPQNQAIDNTAKPKTTSFFPLHGSSKGTNQYLKWPPCTWHTWKRKVPKGTRKWKAKTLTVSMGLWKSSWCAPCEGCEGCPSGGEALLSLQ